MHFARLGNSGLLVSQLSYGTMTFTEGNKSLASVYKTTRDDAEKLVHRALDAGINFFDTANGYAGGESERMLGALLATHRKEVVLATKVGFRTGTPLLQSGLSRRNLFEAIDASLQRLNTDWIDLYLVHREDPFTPLEETLSALDAIVRAGKVRYLGFSNWSAWRAAAAIELQRKNGWAPFINGQMYYSLVARDVERDVVPMMQHYGVGMTVWSPLAGGFLSGKYSRKQATGTSDDRLSGFDILPFDKEKGFTIVDALQDIARAHNASPAQVALRWLLDRAAVSSIIVGASKLSQLEDNLGALTLSLTTEETERLHALSALGPVYPNWFIDRLRDEDTAKALRR